MLDRDLATLYMVKPIRLREQVKRNAQRFPKEFCFQVSKEEADFLLSQNAIPSKKHLGGFLPYVFTEQGVAMLSGVLRSEMAVKTSIVIINAFVEMRRFLYENSNFFQKFQQIDQKLIEHDKNFEKVFNAIEENEIKPKKGIFFDGQVYDAYDFITKLIKSAKDSIILVDNYIDTSVLTLLAAKNTGVNVKIYAKKISEKLILAEKKFNDQYNNLELIEFDRSHDRFLVIDGNNIYHIGASLKDLGKRWFAFSRFDKRAVDILRRL